MAAGDELLIADGIESHRAGMRKLFEDEGYVCTTVETIDRARALVEEKFFPAVLVDLDIERPSAGLELMRSILDRSAPTAVVLLTGRRSYDSAVEAFRHGAEDVVLKQPEHVQHLKQTVEIACDRHRATRSDTDLIRDMRTVLDEAFGVMLELARTVYRDVSVGSAESFKPRVLLVDDNQDFLQELAKQLDDENWEVTVEMSGGAALDKAGTQAFDIVAARDDLVDLKGSMVIKTVQANRAECIGILYSAPGAEGRLERYHQGKSQDAERPFRGADHLAEALGRAADELSATQADRRVIRAFRRDHEDFLRRYAELKSRLDRL